MKFRRTLSSVIISVFLVLAVLFAVVYLQASSYGMDKLRSAIQNFIPEGQTGLEVTMESVDGTLMKAIVVKNLRISAGETPLAVLGRVELSFSVWDFLKLAVLGYAGELSVTAEDADLYVNDFAVDTLMRTDSAKGEAKEETGVHNGNSGKGEPSVFDEFGIAASIRNLNVYADYSGIKAVSRGINATAELGKGLVFRKADLNVPGISAGGGPLGNEQISASDVRISVDSDFAVSFSVASASYGKVIRVSSGSAIARISEDVLSAALFINNTKVFNENPLVDASLSGLTVSASYKMKTMEAAFDLTGELLSGAVSDFDFDAGIENFHLKGSFNGVSDISLDVSSEALKASFQSRKANLSGLSSELELVSGGDNGFASMGHISLKNASFEGLEDFNLSDSRLSDAIIDYSYSESGLGLRIRSTVEGNCGNELIGSFSAKLDAGVQTRDFRTVSNVSLALKDLKCASLSERADFDLAVNGNSNARINFSSAEDLRASIGYDGEKFDISLNLSSFSPGTYELLYRKFLSWQSFVSTSTYFDGSLFVSAYADEGFKSWISSFMGGDYSAVFHVKTPFDIVKGGRLSLNAAARNIMIGESVFSGAFTFEAGVDEKTAEIDTFAVTTGNTRISYSGSIDFNELVPEGRLSVQRLSDGMELAGIDLSHADGTKIYEFVARSQFVRGAGLSGSINWNDINRITASVQMDAPFLESEGIALDAVLFTNPFSLKIDGSVLDIEAGIEEGKVIASGSLNNMVFRLDENVNMNASTLINAGFFLEDGSFFLSFNNLAVSVSNMISARLDMDITDHSLGAENLSLSRGTIESKFHPFNGKLDITFDSIKALLNGDTSSVTGKMDFESDDGFTDISGAITEDRYYFELSHSDYTLKDAGISFLGRRGGAFYGSGRLAWGENGANKVSVNAIFEDNVLSLYDSGGTIGSLNINDINFSADFSKMLLEGSMSFLNEKKLMSGELSTQSGTVTAAAKVDSITGSVWQILAGENYSVDFSLGLSDIILSDGYRIADTNVALTMTEKDLTFSGNMINGKYDMETGYIDIDIDKKLLFGFKAKGYVGRNLDFVVSDLYFPLPILNQFIDTPMLTFLDGVIEGNVLVKGPVSNPGFYGMGFCQSYEMSIFYVPDQVLTVKNVSAYIQDHTLIISRTPMSGYSENDGRYFYGDVAASLVMQNNTMESFDVSINVNEETPVNFWLPIVSDDMEMEVRGDVSGYMNYELGVGRSKLAADLNVSSTLLDFRFDEKLPDWLYASANNSSFIFDMDINLTTGHDVEFYYPEKDNSFINFTLAENKTARLMLNDNVFSTDGGVSLKTGQVYYLHNDFIIKEGSVDLTERKYSGNSSAIPFLLNLTAELTDYDADGNKITISLILQDSTLDNISPRFSSIPAKDEKDILAMLGQSVLSSSALDQSLSLSSLASFAATATDALTKVGIIESNTTYSIGATIRNALGLDIFSARSNIVSNVIINALPGDMTGRSNVSMLARYLDMTSIFAGKYLSPDWFIKVRLMLKADTGVKKSDKTGHFLAKDLILDTEISLDWETPMGTLSIFTYPRELSVFDFLDTIGFSVTKQIQL